MRPVTALTTLCLGCAPDLREDRATDSLPPSADTGALFTDGDERSLTVNATATDAWVYLSLSDGALLSPADPAQDLGWRLALQRYNLAVSGGVSGPAGVEVAPVEGQSLDEVTAAPADGWRTDLADADGDGVPEYALGDWYVYDATTHVLTPADRVYALCDGAGACFKLAVEGYYDDAGTPAMVSLRWAPLPSR
ncbi:HmuY family protein [Myxococcota bacterium]|nr:HmuY family protein [Myxococcota bacterium]